MPKIRLWIGEARREMDARLFEAIRRYEAGEVLGECDNDFGFQNWEHFASILKTESPELADELLTMPEADRYAVFDTPAGQEILTRLWDRTDIDTSCPG